MKRNAGYATRVKLDFLYDSQHRRVSKAVSTTTSQLVNPTWTLQGTTRFLYDDWNMIAQYSFAANVFTAQAQYVWGLDVNGAMQAAGGVGGLLHAVLIDSANAPCLPCYDGNGNIAAWVHGGNGSLIERREYDSFGNMITVFRLAADAALHAKLFYGFSTKWRDPENELLYYGYRYYNPNTQRWLNRDPIEEAGGVNLYGFVGNDGVNNIDKLGNTSIGTKLVTMYTGRFVSGSPGTLGIGAYFNSKMKWFPIPDEEHEMNPLTQNDRMWAYKNWVCSLIPLPTRWTTYTNIHVKRSVPNVPIFTLTGWILRRGTSLDGFGQLEACNQNGKVCIKNRKFLMQWYDEMDANEFKTLGQVQPNIIEGMADLIADDLPFNSNFFFTVNWFDVDASKICFDCNNKTEL